MYQLKLLPLLFLISHFYHLPSVYAYSDIEYNEMSQNGRRNVVRFVYLVSKDRSINKDYLNSIESAAINVQKFYYDKLDGSTFKLNYPIVEVLKSDKAANFFYSNPSDQNPDNWGFFNTYNEVKRILGNEFNDLNSTWVIYSDGPGDKGRGIPGFCVMPENDLIGLIGKHHDQPKKERWIGGLAHELGHAFGLGHPKDTENHGSAIMWSGFYDAYPDEAYFTLEDKNILSKSAFFEKALEKRIKYPEGYFIGKNLTQSEWTEYSNKTNLNFKFKLLYETEAYYILKSTDRELLLKLPHHKGQSYLSVDGNKTWQNWWWID
jgi:hypothetical protein